MCSYYAPTTYEIIANNFNSFQPKYIHNILKSAERRTLEKERRTERKVQSEREAERGMFDDKESFVTASYLSKLEEIKKAELQDKIESMAEGWYHSFISASLLNYPIMNNVPLDSFEKI